MVALEFYDGKTVFLTGISGFIGRLLLSKLLRLGNVKEILLLLRPKKGLSNEERLDKILQGVLYEKCEKGFRNKIRIINGDLESKQLGISPKDQEYIKNTAEIFIHGAATVRFDEDLKKALTINVLGSKYMVDLALETKNLVSFVYISTAYSQCPLARVKETFYEAPMTYQKALEMCEMFDNKILNAVTPRLIAPWPNTYTFSKAIAEDLMRQHVKVLPIGIIRPTIVQTTYKDPVHGFGDKIIGPIGLAVGIQAGLIRIVKTDPLIALDIIPADLVTNATLAIAWETSKEQRKLHERRIFHSTICNIRKTTITFALSMIAKLSEKSPTKKMVWLPLFNGTSCEFMYRFLFILYHYIPAIFFDIFLKIKGSKHSLFKLYSKVFEQSKLLNYFMLRSWHFEDSNMREMTFRMSEKDMEIFPLVIRAEEYECHAVTGTEGLRRHFFKENDEDLKIARKRYKIFKVLHYTLLAVLYSGMFLFVINFVESSFRNFISLFTL